MTGQTSVTTDEQSKPDTSSSARCEEQRLGLYAHLLRRQLERILVLVDLEEDGQAVVPDGFSSEERALREPSSTLANNTCHYGFLPSYSRHEPRLEVIQNTLQRALKLGRFHRNGEVVAVDGFRLRNLRQWANYPMESLLENIGSLSNRCNCNCRFCYVQGSREGGLVFNRSQVSRQEVATRIRYYSPERYTGLVPTSRVLHEPLANPDCIDILEQVHTAAPQEFIYLLTNGSGLTEENIARLAKCRPLSVVVSLNGASVEARMKSVRDHRREYAETALESVKLLRKYEIPFSGSYVPWPCNPLSDLEEMAYYLDRYDSVKLRVCLPGFNQYAYPKAPFDTDEYWTKIVTLLHHLRSKVEIPIYIKPAMYQVQTMRPVVLGTIKQSPAAHAGLKPYDLILEIEGKNVWTRPQVSRLLRSRLGNPQIESTNLTIQRNGDVIALELSNSCDPEQFGYPYRYLADHRGPLGCVEILGIYMPDGLELSSIIHLKEICESHSGQTVLFYIGQLAEQPFVEALQMLGDESRFIDEVDLHVEKLVPRHWGGNTMIGDLWACGDVIERTKEWIAEHGVNPDVLVVPKTFLSAGGRDLTGRSYRDIERHLDVELHLLDCNRIWL